MAKKKNIPQRTPELTAKKMPVAAAPVVNESGPFRISYPLLWLALIPLVVYIPSFFFKFTDLDDTIFIRDFAAYNEDLHNLLVSFQRGLFDVVKDPYYRPLFLDSMVLNYHLSGQDIMGYHIVNVLLHIVSVLLLYKLFRKLHVKELYAFILTMLFAVHPVLSQAVAWIPGRNDTLLAVFVFPFLIYSIDYSLTGKIRSLVLSVLFLLLAYFTKETAVFAAPVAFVLIVFVMQQKWLDRKNIIQYILWAACFVFWFIVRSEATIQPGNFAAGAILTEFVHRLPVIIQYLGKIFLPFNLSVFPIQEDTVYYYGIVAIMGLGVILFLNRNRNMRLIGAGLGIFLLFLLPVLLVPGNLNDQTFEHRLYLPFIGILFLLPQSVLFENKLSDRNLLIGWGIICGALAFINYQHQKDFSDPLTFWTAAAETSPHSAYANMMLGARDTEPGESEKLFRKAYQLNPKEKYLNFYYGVMLQKEDSVQQSEKYLLTEKSISNYYECDFYLARVAAERKDFAGAITDLETYLKKDPNNKMAYNNLLLLYLQTGQKVKAAAEVKNMQQMGMDVPKQIFPNKY